MEPAGALALSQVNKQVRSRSDNLLRDQYQKIYGAISLENKPERKIVARLLCYAEKQPDAAVNHNTNKAPSNEVERRKWLSGVENSLDKEVQKNYDDGIHLLENTRGTSIIQLKNQMMGFWHLNQQIKDYKKFKSEKIALETGIVSSCTGYVSKLIWNPQVISIGESLESRSRKTFAKIGEFKLDEKSCDVVAFHILGDENRMDKYATYNNESHRQFNSLSHGETNIGIFEEKQPHLLTSLGHYGSNQSFSVLIGRMTTAENVYNFISSEKIVGHVEKLVSDSQRHLLIDNALGYRNRTRDIQGSDRLLDQKLTQIMAEMVMQNHNIISLTVGSNHDDLPVLTAGGFDSLCATKVMQELEDFRSQEGNKLFPPYKDYRGVNTSLPKQSLNNKAVFFSKGAPESWVDIIKREPILKARAGVLPEYWAVKPNIAQK